MHVGLDPEGPSECLWGERATIIGPTAERLARGRPERGSEHPAQPEQGCRQAHWLGMAASHER